MKENIPKGPPARDRRPATTQSREAARQPEKKDMSRSPMTKWEGVDGKEKIKEWLESGISADTNNFARAFGDYLAGKSKEEREEKRRIYGEVFASSSVRSFYCELMRLARQFDASQALLLRPRLQYRQSESGSARGKAFAIIADAGLEAALQTDSPEKQSQLLKNLFAFVEIVLSYHKAAGGK